MTAVSTRPAAWPGPLALAGLLLVFTVACGGWMVAMHEAGHAETRQDIASVNQAVWNTSRGRFLQATILYEGVRDHLEIRSREAYEKRLSEFLAADPDGPDPTLQ